MTCMAELIYIQHIDHMHYILATVPLSTTYFLYGIKVSKNHNDLMKTAFGPKSNIIIVRISALFIVGQKS